MDQERLGGRSHFGYTPLASPHSQFRRMPLLFDELKTKTVEWREQGFSHEEFSPIAEILEWASSPEGSGFQLRPPQLHALEVYWYLRLVQDTPKLFDLYQRQNCCCCESDGYVGGTSLSSTRSLIDLCFLVRPAATKLHNFWRLYSHEKKP